MANVATMGPPPSPKEPRRSGRRPAASSSRSPVGSPPSEGQPKPKDNVVRTPAPTSHTNGRNKRAKNEDLDEPQEEIHRNGVTGNGGSLRTKRKGKDKDKHALVLEIPNDEHDVGLEVVGEDAPAGEGEDEEEAGVTRCICQKYGEEENEQGEFMVQCETCKAWQHGQCMHYEAMESVPQQYFCEECEPELWGEVIRAWSSKHTRHSSSHSHSLSHSHPPLTPTVATVPRTSRSHSPAVSKTTKRRNTMNSRDAAYDEEKFQALIDIPRTDHDLPPRTPVSSVSAQGGLNGHTDPAPDMEATTNPKKKRKRTDDDAASVKRTRSASVTSDRPPPSVLARDATPLSAVKGPTALPPVTSTVRTSTARNKRGGGRKAQAQDLASVDGDEVASAAPTRKTNSRAKVNNTAEHSSRRTQTSTAGGNAAGNSAASRAYHSSHAYAVSQQSLFTSWGLPDYLAHLENMLPSPTPRALEVRGTVLDPNGNLRETQELTTERGVKVKWPGKRMSVVDMNKRVRALVEWVGREQAAAMERTRRKEALEKALQLQEAVQAAGEGGLMDVDTGADGSSLPKGNGTLHPGASAPDVVAGRDGEDGTMKMMEELMEELIRFQEQYGPGAKAKERDRRTGTL